MDRFMRSLQESCEEGNEGDVPALLDPFPDSLYVRYKKCTKRFKETLQAMVPAEIFSFDSVSALMTAAEYVAKNDLIQVEPQLLEDLRVAIRVRKRVALDQFAGGDEGNSYFISVLTYCWSILAPKLPRKVRASKQPTNHEASLHNRFEGLSLEEEDPDDDEDDDPEGDLPSSSLARPEAAALSRLSLDELISGSDRVGGISFLMTLDELMHCVSNHYSKLKESAAWIQKDNHPPGIIIEQMIEASVATNFAIQQVASLEESFAHDHPHLNTVYRLRACLELVDLVPMLTRIVSDKSPLAAQFSEKDAVEFLGDAMECAFRNASHPRNRQNTLVKEFLVRWQFSDDIRSNEIPRTTSENIRDIYESVPEQISMQDEMAVQYIFEYVYMLVRIEVPLHQETQVCKIRTLASDIGLSSHTFLK
jgi:hypothetical protein